MSRRGEQEKARNGKEKRGRQRNLTGGTRHWRLRLQFQTRLANPQSNWAASCRSSLRGESPVKRKKHSFDLQLVCVSEPLKNRERKKETWQNGASFWFLLSGWLNNKNNAKEQNTVENRRLQYSHQSQYNIAMSNSAPVSESRADCDCNSCFAKHCLCPSRSVYCTVLY